jgi:rubredoxin
MFRCTGCNKSTEPRQSATRIATVVRPKRYAPTYNDEKERMNATGTGFEAVKEGNYCPTCADKLKDKEPTVQKA